MNGFPMDMRCLPVSGKKLELSHRISEKMGHQS
jgi:hypothetical protein